MTRPSHPVTALVSPRRPGRRTRVSLAVVGIGALVATVLSACSGDSASAHDVSTGLRGQTITLYNAQHPQTTDAMIAAFTKQTGIKVRTVDDDEDVLTAQIEEEGSRSPADVFYTENSNWLQQLADKGLLAKVDPDTLANVPAQDSAADHDWVGVSARISVIVYNPGRISAAQLPSSILDMAEPKYRGKFEIAPSETDFWPIIASVARADGDKVALHWLEGLKANAGSGGDNVPDNETLTSDVSQGITDFAVINHYYYYRLQDLVKGGVGSARLAYFAPRDPGYVEAVSGAAVLKSSTHSAAAQAFLNFMTSRSGQEVLESGASFEYPLKPGVAANPKLPPLSSYRPNSFSPADLGTGEIAKKLLQEAGLI